MFKHTQHSQLLWGKKRNVQLGPGLKSKTKALDQSRTLNSLWTTNFPPAQPRHHPPPTENFSKGSRLRMGTRFGI